MSLNLNLKDFLKYILRFKWVIILLPLLCAVLTYFLVKKLPKVYKSEALISTGLTGQFQASVNTGSSVDYTRLAQQFVNLLEMMKSRKNITALSYRLILHDLTDPANAFKKPSDLITKLSAQDKQTVITEFEKRRASGALISVADNGNRIKLYDILKSMGYDEESLAANLNIFRSGESDFINVEFSSPNPNLSTYVVNNLSNDFINYYTNLLVAGQKQSLAILDSVLRQKQTEMQKQSSRLQGSERSAAQQAAGAANSQRQSDAAYQRVTEAEGQRQQYIRQISSIKGAIAEIDRKLQGAGGYVNQNVSKDNTEILDIDRKIKIANQKYINNNFRPQDKAAVDSLQSIKERLVVRSSGTTNLNPAAVKQDLLNQKIKLENDLASAESALQTVEQQLSVLPKPGGVSVATEQGASQNALREAEIASNEYVAAQTQYNQTSLLLKTGAKLSLAEPGVPGPPERSKNILYVGFSGISSLLICLMTLFIVFALNKTVNNVNQLQTYTQQKVIGCLNYVNAEDKDLRNIWKDNGSVKDYSTYKDLLRSLRFEINEHLSEDKNVLGITSMEDGEGKTFLAGSLSYAFAMMGKNVLLICEKDGNILDLVTNKRNGAPNAPLQKFESFLVKKQIQVEDRITILNRNTSSNNSLLELRDSKSLIAGFEILKDTFDLIIIDVDCARDMHNVKEWLMFCDLSLAVYESGRKYSEDYKPFVNYLSAQPGFLGWVLNKVKAA